MATIKNHDGKSHQPAPRDCRSGRFIDVGESFKKTFSDPKNREAFERLSKK